METSSNPSEGDMEMSEEDMASIKKKYRQHLGDLTTSEVKNIQYLESEMKRQNHYKQFNPLYVSNQIKNERELKTTCYGNLNKFLKGDPTILLDKLDLNCFTSLYRGDLKTKLESSRDSSTDPNFNSRVQQVIDKLLTVGGRTSRTSKRRRRASRRSSRRVRRTRRRVVEEAFPSW